MAFSFMPQQQQQPSSLFQPQPQQQQQSAELPVPSSSTTAKSTLSLYQRKAPASYGTKWADVHPDSQKFLLKIEVRILEYRDESQRLDHCSRLYDSSVSNDGFELDASLIVQELVGISTSIERQKAALQELMIVVKDILRNTEVAIRSFMMLRPTFLHPNVDAALNATSSSQASGTTLTPIARSQSAVIGIVPVFDFYSGLQRKPSPFLQQTIATFEKYIGQSRQWIEELDQLLRLDSYTNSFNCSSSVLQSLPKVMSNVHDFFVHTAAKVESIRQYMESMKTAYLADQRHRGDVSDPFLEADRRETAKKKLLLAGCIQLCICLQTHNNQLKLLDYLPAQQHLGLLLPLRHLQLFHLHHLEVGPHFLVLHLPPCHHLLCSQLLSHLPQCPPYLHHLLPPPKFHFSAHSLLRLPLLLILLRYLVQPLLPECPLSTRSSIGFGTLKFI